MHDAKGNSLKVNLANAKSPERYSPDKHGNLRELISKLEERSGFKLKGIDLKRWLVRDYGDGSFDLIPAVVVDKKWGAKESLAQGPKND